MKWMKWMNEGMKEGRNEWMDEWIDEVMYNCNGNTCNIQKVGAYRGNDLEGPPLSFPSGSSYHKGIPAGTTYGIPHSLLGLITLYKKLASKGDIPEGNSGKDHLLYTSFPSWSHHTVQKVRLQRRHTRREFRQGPLMVYLIPFLVSSHILSLSIISKPSFTRIAIHDLYNCKPQGTWGLQQKGRPLQQYKLHALGFFVLSI